MRKSELNATAASLLGFLHEGPLTGSDLLLLAQERIGDFWHITRSQIYRELASMTTLGLVEAGIKGARGKQPFTITPTGKNAFNEWVNTEPDIEYVRFPLLLSIHFAGFADPNILASSVSRHQLIHKQRLLEYQQTSDFLDTLDSNDMPDLGVLATLRFGLLYEKAVLDWFDGLPESLKYIEPGENTKNQL